MRGRIQDLIVSTRGQLLSGSLDTMFSGISTDSRTITKGELFVALKGETFDGHGFLKDAFARGAAGALVMQPVDIHSVPVVLVDDTLKALGALAGDFRRRFEVKIVGITGSTGKTIVKELVASILALKGTTLKTQKNYNNLIGVPLRLFELKPEHKFAVVEMGTNHPGEIERLSAMTMPMVSILTNITPAHLNGLGSIDGIIAEKQSIFLNTMRVAIINPHAQYMDKVHIPDTLEVVTFSDSNKADVTPKEITRQTLAGTELLLDFRGHLRRLLIPLPGMHNVLNTLAAAACAVALNIDLDAIVSGIENATFPGMRSEIIVSEKLTIIDDSYNANPASMKAALDMLVSAPHAHKIAVLGDMLELGKDSRYWHEQLGKWVAQAHIDRLIVTGEMAKVVAEAAMCDGMKAGAIAIVDTMEHIVSSLSDSISRETIVLVKASRGLKLDRVVTYLKAVA